MHAPGSQPVRGRGAATSPPARFESAWAEAEPELDLGAEPRPDTRLVPDSSRSIVATNNSPDLPFEASVNPYRGCEHGCIYCYARPTHEYLGFSAGLEFETRIVVKEDAPALLRKALRARSWKPKVLAFSGVTDCYQPLERRLRLTRGCLEVLAELRNPVGIITKNHLVTRDIDLLQELARHRAVSVALSLTSLDPALTGVLEPRTSRPHRRLAAVSALAEAGIPVGVMVAPVIPGLNDREIPAILAAAAEAGAGHATMLPLRLPLGVAPLFEAWLEQHRPREKEKILARIRAMRGGRLNETRFGARFRGEGAYAQQTQRMFAVHRERVGLAASGPRLSTAAFRRCGKQLELFG